jgi:hypothetical protein
MITTPTARFPRLVDHFRKVLVTRRLRYDGLVRPFGPGVHREVQLELDFRPRPRAQVR